MTEPGPTDETEKARFVLRFFIDGTAMTTYAKVSEHGGWEMDPITGIREQKRNKKSAINVMFTEKPQVGAIIQMQNSDSNHYYVEIVPPPEKAPAAQKASSVYGKRLTEAEEKEKIGKDTKIINPV